MQGTINVSDFMDYHHRQQRMLEWLYLKEYWRADEGGKREVLRLYGKPLVKALAKYYPGYKQNDICTNPVK